jgi:membrane protein implicated in regulation of membrane protease activity
MYKNFVGALYVVNIVFQCILTLLFPAALMFFAAWLFISKLGAPVWLYAILVPIGFVWGLISMIKFAIAASEGLERLEKQAKGKNQGGDNK